MNDEGRVAFVTGGARGIGWATCQELVEHGWSVVIGDVDEASATDRAQNHPAVFGVGLDVTSARSVEAAFNLAIERFDRLDLLVNNAGIQRHGPMESLAWDDWTAVLDVNLHGVFRCMQVAGRHMLAAGRGSMVNIVSIAAQRGAPGRAAYVASKAAIAGLTRTAAVEWARRGVRVNAVGPGFVDTDLLQQYVEAGRVELEPILQRTPVHRLAKPREIARAVRFLGSDDASYITGQVLYVDGGFLANYGVPSSMGRDGS